MVDRTWIIHLKQDRYRTGRVIDLIKFVLELQEKGYEVVVK